MLAGIAKLCDDAGMDIELDTQVREALQQRRGDWPQIAAKAEVSHSWISQFVRHKIPNPGYATLKRLHAELVTAEHPAPEPAAAVGG